LIGLGLAFTHEAGERLEAAGIKATCRKKSPQGIGGGYYQIMSGYSAVFRSMPVGCGMRSALPVRATGVLTFVK